jgi:sec-independent protein translocase protein TatC
VLKLIDCKRETINRAGTAMPRNAWQPDSEDLFADTRMSFGEHIEDLRTHLLRALVGFFVCLLVSFLFSHWIVEFIKAPIEEQLMEFYKRRVERVAKKLAEGDPTVTSLDELKEMPVVMKRSELRKLLAEVGMQMPKAKEGTSEDDYLTVPLLYRPVRFAIISQEAQRLVGRPPQLSTMNVMEGFMVYVKVSIITGLVLSSPWIFWQLWSFIAAGLYPTEKRYVHRYLPFSIALFLAGVVVCQFLVIPKAIEALLWFNEWLGLEPDLRLNEWLGFALLLPVVFGLSFQTPMVMVVLAKVGMVDADSFRKKRRIAWFGMSIFAAIFTPADALSMLMMLVPMIGLYELGIILVRHVSRPESEVPEMSEEDQQLIGV